MSYYLSYLMGAEKIEDKELEDLDIKIENKDSDGDRSIKIPEEKLSHFCDYFLYGSWTLELFSD